LWTRRIIELSKHRRRPSISAVINASLELAAEIAEEKIALEESKAQQNNTSSTAAVPAQVTSR
jgi:hypothetical protein